MLYTYIQHYRAHFYFLVKPGREVLSLSVYLLPPHTGQGPREWRNILRTNYWKRGLRNVPTPPPLPHLPVVYKGLPAIRWQSPIPIHHLNFSQEACALHISLSLYFNIPIPETSLIPRSLAHSCISELIPGWAYCKLWTNLWYWANRYLWAVSPDLCDLWAKS